MATELDIAPAGEEWLSLCFPPLIPPRRHACAKHGRHPDWIQFKWSQRAGFSNLYCLRCIVDFLARSGLPGVITVPGSLEGGGSGGGGGGGGTVTPPVTPAPSITMTVNPTTVAAGGSATITWSTTDATSCSASGAWSGAQGTSGTFPTGAINATATYTLTCTGPGGPTTRSVTIPVTPVQAAPTVTLVASPVTVPSGGSSLLTWSSTDAAVVTASGGWSGNLTPVAAGSKQSGTLTSTTTFTVVASNAVGNSAPASATVTVQATGTTANYTLVAGGFVGSGYIVSEIGYVNGSQQAQYQVGSLSPTTLFSTGLTIRDIFSHLSASQELDVWIQYSASTTQTNLFDYVQIVDDAGATRTFYSNNLGTGAFDSDGATWQHWYWKMGTNAPAMNTVGKTYHVTFYKA